MTDEVDTRTFQRADASTAASEPARTRGSLTTVSARLTAFTIFLALLIAPGKAYAQADRGVTPAECAAYEKTVNSDAVPRELLKAWPTALGCLVKIIRDLKVTSVEAASRKELLTASRAIRVILDENKGPGIRRFRDIDDVDVVTALSFGARIPGAENTPNRPGGESTPGRDMRLNATLILGNVIDNTTVCVPIDHLFDPAIGTNGRANLLAIVSEVASWALKENLDNIERMMATTKDRTDRTLPDTSHIWTNLETKVAARKEKIRSETRPSNADAELQSCIRYASSNAKKWAQDDLRY